MQTEKLMFAAQFGQYGVCSSPIGSTQGRPYWPTQMHRVYWYQYPGSVNAAQPINWQNTHTSETEVRQPEKLIFCNKWLTAWCVLMPQSLNSGYQILTHTDTYNILTQISWLCECSSTYKLTDNIQISLRLKHWGTNRKTDICNNWLTAWRLLMQYSHDPGTPILAHTHAENILTPISRLCECTSAYKLPTNT
jgi:hypothetical protein